MAPAPVKLTSAQAEPNETASIAIDARSMTGAMARLIRFRIVLIFMMFLRLISRFKACSNDSRR